jgi:CelD/BcsL family acetyltransferase involved in cellulose biosynthesis
VDALLAPGGPWDRLVERGGAYPLFLRSGWMRAHRSVFAGSRRVVLAIAADGPEGAGEWIAGGAFMLNRTRGEFCGSGPCDYLDVVVDRRVGPREAAGLKRGIVQAVCGALGRGGELRLGNVPVESGTPEALASSDEGLHSTVLRSHPAPTLDLEGAAKVLGSKHVRRCENRLRRSGDATCRTFCEVSEVLPRLDAFFDQHVRRWSGTPSPSLFESEENRDFYRRLTRELSETGVLRFTELRLDGVLAAAHYGFCDGGRYVWYKPSYEPRMAELSPGVALIARLVQRALEEGASELDFTIGDEAFKERYATRRREVVDVAATRSRLRAARLRTTLALRNGVKAGLRGVGALEAARRLLGR